MNWQPRHGGKTYAMASVLWASGGGRLLTFDVERYDGDQVEIAGFRFKVTGRGERYVDLVPA